MAEPGFSLSGANVAVIGLGLMGGSLALSIKDKCRKLSAYDSNLPTLELALQNEIVHVADSNPTYILRDADLVILACPVSAILDWINLLPKYVQHSCIVIDLGSSKRMIVDALNDLPEYFDPIGGHPICGSERLSLGNATADMYRNAPFVLTPFSRTSEIARNAALQLVEALRANPIWQNPDEHDRLLAGISHMPYLLSSALALATSKEGKLFIGPGFRSSSRLAGTPSSMMLDVVLTNKDYVLESIGHFQTKLSAIESALLEDDISRLESILSSAQEHYHLLI
jgi:prephenate dehydrogenase